MAVGASIGEIRDVVIIVYGIIGIFCFFISVIIALVLGLSVRGLIRSVRELLDDSIKPTVDSIKEAAETVRGTTEFVGRNAVMPIARTYGAFAGVRKGLGVLAGFNRRRAK